MQEKEVGMITHFYGKPSVGIVELKDSLSVGDTIHIKGPHDDVTCIVSSMQIEHQTVSSAGKGDVVGIKVPHKIHEQDKVYVVTP